jgi:PhzF family phenazine biosynthesis protein
MMRSIPRPSEIPVFVVDAFTGEPFRGNPAGVVLLEREKDEAWMQAFAAEMKHAETAYLVPDGSGYHLRWFTPVNEVDLCGHATLASAHVLWETGRLPVSSAARFKTKSGTLTARLVDGGIEMDFPAEPPVEVAPRDIPQGLNEALKSKPTFVGKNRMDYLLELEGEDAVRALDPDLRSLAGVSTRGFIVTARSHTPGVDFISRFFAPAFGIDEDPVTGSAHCCLAPYWSAKLGKTEMVGYQASPRGATIGVIHRGDRVALIGKAVTVLKGAIPA